MTSIIAKYNTFCYKVQQGLLQSASRFIRKCDKCIALQMRHGFLQNATQIFLQSATWFITKGDKRGIQSIQQRPSVSCSEKCLHPLNNLNLANNYTKLS